MRQATAREGGEEARGAPAAAAATDPRDHLFAPVAGRAFAFEITATQAAVLAGTVGLAEQAAALGVALAFLEADGARLAPGAVVCRARGDAGQVARAEEALLGPVGKASGVATAAAALVAQSAGRARVVCGAWKKLPAAVRPELRRAVAVGGAGLRILDRPFTYLDKNYVRMMGGVAPAVRRARALAGRAVVVQLRGETAAIGEEAARAADEGADLLLVDTGELADLAPVAAVVRRHSGALELGFAGGVDASTLAAALDAGARVVDVGRAILDAPLADFRLDVR